MLYRNKMLYSKILASNVAVNLFDSLKKSGGVRRNIGKYVFASQSYNQPYFIGFI